MPVQEKFDNVLSWASDLDEKTREQARKTAALPFVEGPMALMSDAHLGYGCAIGAVVPTRGAIIPSAVGVDVGCGLIGVETSLSSTDLPDDLSGLHDMLVARIPTGVGKGHVTWDTDHSHMPQNSIELDNKKWDTAWLQFGSLGTGNHHIEVSTDERDVVWITLHSGSRGIGNKLATSHIEKAKGIMKEFFIELPDPDLAYLVEGRQEFDAYIRDLLWAQDYALGSRETMMDVCLASLVEFLGIEGNIELDRINSHHNYAARENHKGKNLWITRKGAVRARVGDRGIIPGSMATSTFVVTGLGNPASFQSCSHGAGRRMSRSEARRTLDIETLNQAMEGKAWDSSHAKALIDEDPRAYKDVNEVMRNQADLVAIDHTLHQVLNMKGA